MQASTSSQSTIIRLVTQTKHRFCLYCCLVIGISASIFLYCSLNNVHSPLIILCA